jgi:hypothetical protein
VSRNDLLQLDEDVRLDSLIITPPPLKTMEAIALIDAPWISAVTDEVRDINTAEPRATSTVLTAAPEADHRRDDASSHCWCV